MGTVLLFSCLRLRLSDGGFISVSLKALWSAMEYLESVCDLVFIGERTFACSLTGSTFVVVLWRCVKDIAYWHRFMC